MYTFLTLQPAIENTLAYCYNKNHNSANSYHNNMNDISFYYQINSLL